MYLVDGKGNSRKQIIVRSNDFVVFPCSRIQEYIAQKRSAQDETVLQGSIPVNSAILVNFDSFKFTCMLCYRSYAYVILLVQTRRHAVFKVY